MKSLTNIAWPRTNSRVWAPGLVAGLRSPSLDLSLSAYSASAEEVGGDFYEVLPVTPGRLLLIVADVMGKGSGAAVLAERARRLVHELSQSSALCPSSFSFFQPGQLLERLNRELYEELSASGVFITAQAALVNRLERKITVANAGHCPLLLASEDGGCRALAPEGMPLGIMPSETFPEVTMELDSFTCALLYTDGVSEARDERGNFLGEEPLRRWLAQSALLGLPASTLAQQLKAELRSFQCATMPRDDQTFVVLTADGRPQLSQGRPGISRSAFDGLEFHRATALAA